MAISTPKENASAPIAVPHCPRCDSVELRRHARIGFLQNRVLPYFGLFPWECAQCRRMFLLRRRRAERPASGVRRNVVAMKTADNTRGLKGLAEKAIRLQSKSRFG